MGKGTRGCPKLRASLAQDKNDAQLEEVYFGGGGKRKPVLERKRTLQSSLQHLLNT